MPQWLRCTGSARFSVCLLCQKLQPVWCSKDLLKPATWVAQISFCGMRVCVLDSRRNILIATYLLAEGLSLPCGIAAQIAGLHLNDYICPSLIKYLLD